MQVWNLLGRTAAPPFSAVLWCELEAGGRVGRHRQQQDPEIVLCMEGNGLVSVGRKKLPFNPGDMAYLPHGEVLGIENQSQDTPLRYLIIKARNPGKDGQV